MDGVRFDDRMNALCSRTENKVSITLLSDPPSGVKVEAKCHCEVGWPECVFTTIPTIFLLTTPATSKIPQN
jgi:hypothetical protein